MNFKIPKFGLLSYLMIIITISNVIVAYCMIRIVVYSDDLYVKATVYGTTKVNVTNSSREAIPVEMRR
jgi:hypothetical protein